MSAAEIIEQIKTLPKDQRDEVAEFIRNWSDTDAREASGASREERFRRAADKVFSEHHDLLRRLAQ